MFKAPANILITGASSGIGEALALYYAQNGAKTLFLGGRNKNRLEKVAQQCRAYDVTVITKTLNVTERENVAKWISQCNKKAPLDIVFANAGVSTGEETAENIYNTFNTNVFGVLNTVLPTIEIFEKNTTNTPKSIVITASIAGYHGLAGCPSYSATKACVKAWGEALRPRLAHKNIQVNIVCPGFVRSRITDKNTCPMPFFMEADKAAAIIATRVQKNIGLISFPWPMRFAAWFGSVLPNCISNYLYRKLPYKV